MKKVKKVIAIMALLVMTTNSTSVQAAEPPSNKMCIRDRCRSI